MGNMYNRKYEDSIRQDEIEHRANQKIRNLDNIVEALKNGGLSIFAGAGLSAASGYVDWKQLLKPMCEQLGLNINMDLTLIAQYYENEYTRHGLNQAILKEFSKVPKKNDNMEILASLPISNYWTTNYDSIIEDTLEEKGKVVDVISEQIQYKNHTPGRDAVVYKMHGDKSIPDRTVITKTDYEVYDTNRSVFTNGLIMELIKNTMLFIGFGFSDPNLDRIISLVRHTFENYSPPNHYCFMRSVRYEEYVDENGELSDEKRREYEQDKRLQDLRIKSMTTYGIQTILVEDFKQITEMLKYIRFKYTLSKVFISGGLRPDNPRNYGGSFNKSEGTFVRGERFIMELSKRIIDEGYDVVSGFGVGIGNYVVSGAYMGGMRRGGADYVAKHLNIQPLISVEGQDKTTKESVRKKLISECGTVIFLFGKTEYKSRKTKKIGNELKNDGTYLEYEISKKEEKSIIPIGATGWTTKYIYNEVKNKYRNRKYFKELENEDADNETLIENIMKVIENEKRNREIEMRGLLMKSVFLPDDVEDQELDNSADDTIKVFLSFHYKSAVKQAEMILKILEDTDGIQPVKEMEEVSKRKDISTWIDEKIQSTSVTILLLNKEISNSNWVEREINKSIEANNKFVLIDISNNTYDKEFVEKFKIGSKYLNEVYKVHSIQNIEEEGSFGEIGQWVRSVVNKA